VGCSFEATFQLAHLFVIRQHAAVVVLNSAHVSDTVASPSKSALPHETPRVCTSFNSTYCGRATDKPKSCPQDGIPIDAVRNSSWRKSAVLEAVLVFSRVGFWPTYGGPTPRTRGSTAITSTGAQLPSGLSHPRLAVPRRVRQLKNGTRHF
jgi:hypothetical protein